MGRKGHGPKWSWAEMVMGRNDPESFLRVKGKVGNMCWPHCISLPMSL